jgi:hypothetical protein
MPRIIVQRVTGLCWLLGFTPFIATGGACYGCCGVQVACIPHAMPGSIIAAIKASVEFL